MLFPNLRGSTTENSLAWLRAAQLGTALGLNAAAQHFAPACRNREGSHRRADVDRVLRQGPTTAKSGKPSRRTGRCGSAIRRE
jgi:hypothetical protein